MYLILSVPLPDIIVEFWLYVQYIFRWLCIQKNDDWMQDRIQWQDVELCSETFWSTRVTADREVVLHAADIYTSGQEEKNMHTEFL